MKRSILFGAVVPGAALLLAGALVAAFEHTLAGCVIAAVGLIILSWGFFQLVRAGGGVIPHQQPESAAGASRARFSTYTMAVVGLMAALVFAGTYLHIDIPTPLGKTMIHFGNVICLLAAILFGGPVGGLAAGFGSAIFDLFDPVFAPEFWITFILKGAMGLIAGSIAHAGSAAGRIRRRNVLAACAGAMSYWVLYVSKTIVLNRFVLGAEWGTVWTVVATKGGVSLVNALIAVVISFVLSESLRPPLTAAGVFKKLRR